MVCEVNALTTHQLFELYWRIGIELLCRSWPVLVFMFVTLIVVLQVKEK